METGLIHSGASAQAADRAALLSRQQEFAGTSHPESALEAVEPEDKRRGSAEGLERDYVALFPKETCHLFTGRGLLAFSDSLVNNLKSFPQVPRSVKTIT